MLAFPVVPAVSVERCRRTRLLPCGSVEAQCSGELQCGAVSKQWWPQMPIPHGGLRCHRPLRQYVYSGTILQTFLSDFANSCLTVSLLGILFLAERPDVIDATVSARQLSSSYIICKGFLQGFIRCDFSGRILHKKPRQA